jgi:hypothetical protein
MGFLYHQWKNCYGCFVFVLGLVYPMLPVSLNCLCPRSCSPNVTSVSGLSLSWVLFIQCYQCLWIVFVLGLVHPMLPVSLDCLCSGSCSPNVTSVSGLSLSWVLLSQCYQCLCIVFVLGLVYPMLPLSLDCPFVIAPFGFLLRLFIYAITTDENNSNFIL